MLTIVVGLYWLISRIGSYFGTVEEGAAELDDNIIPSGEASLTRELHARGLDHVYGNIATASTATTKTAKKQLNSDVMGNKQGSIKTGKGVRNTDKSTKREVIKTEVEIVSEKTATTSQWITTFAEVTKESPTATDYNDFPFLRDPETIKFITNSHTLFIMRGLSGSGKSHLVGALQQTYPDAVVCSADHYFMNKDGEYKYDKAKIGDAHKYCQDKASDCCVRDEHVVIIDNTNIQRWTMAHYVRLAQNVHGCHVFIVEPQTPWRYDVNELVLRNSHGVDRETLVKKLQSLQNQTFLPFYYGWFLSRAESQELVDMTRSILQECADKHQDGEDDNEEGRQHSMQGILENFATGYNKPKPVLHCTACFMDRNGTNKAYHSNEMVQKSFGKVFPIQIVGFVYTDRAISARVNLFAAQENSSDTTKTTSSESAISSDMLKLFQKPEEDALREKHKDDKTRTNYQTFFKHGSSAHVTIACAVDGQSKHSGDDILNMSELEYFEHVTKQEVASGTLYKYKNGMNEIRLRQPTHLTGLYHGFYSSSSR